MARRTRSNRTEEDTPNGMTNQRGGLNASGGSGSADPATNAQANTQAELLGAVQALTGVVQMLHQHGQVNQPAPPPQHYQMGNGGFLKFKGLAPAPFSGSTNPLECESWIIEMEKAFRVHVSSEVEKVNYATYLLQGDAYNWWRMEERRLGDRVITWEEFKEIFFKKYFPRSVQTRMENEFIKLEQKNLTIAQYETEFTRLAQFAPTVVATEETKIHRFVQGLRPRLKQAVNAFELPTYAEVVNKALLIEGDLNDIQKERDQQQNKKKRGSSGQGEGQYKKKKESSSAPTNQQGNPQGTGLKCPNCGRGHLAKDCRWVTGGCFRCGKMDHKIAACPLILGQPSTANQGKSHQPQSKTQGRVYTLTQQDAAASNSVVTGMSLGIKIL